MYDWIEFVQQNRTALDLRFMWSKPKHPRKDWKGDYTRHIQLWMGRSGAKRLYIPLSMMIDAGYIDLYNKTYRVTTDAEGAEDKLREVYAYLSEHAR